MLRSRKSRSRKSTVVALVTGSLAALVTALPATADASILDLGGQAGGVRRNLSDTNYKMGFAWELHGEFAMLPPILMIGPYFGMQTLTPETKLADPKSINFRTIGVHAKLKIPLPGGFRPYGLLGAAWVHGDFPDLVAPLPTPPAGVPQDTIKNTVCIAPASPNSSQFACNIPSATANFLEIKVGGGLMIQFNDFIAMNLEVAWRPTVGYKNDTYQQALQGQLGTNVNSTGKSSGSLPDPGRNGYAFTGMLGLQLTI